MNEKLILEMLRLSDKKRSHSRYMYLGANRKEQGKYEEMYLAAYAEFDALVKMVLAFGYTVERDDNDEIIGITRVK